VKTSRGELEFVTFKTYMEPNKNWTHYYNNAAGQKTFKNHKVDLWCPDGTVSQYYGCEFHYHLPPECTQNVGKTIDSLNCMKVPFSKLKQKDEQVKNELLTKYPNDVTSYQIMYECEWKEVKRSEEFLQFKNMYEHFLKRPLHRLIPRTSVRSGFSDVYFLRWEKEYFPDERFIYADIQGLYSSASILFEFPIGQYVTFVGADIDSKISFINGYHYYEDKKLVCGSAFVKIKPPNNLKRPFLQYRINDQFNFLALCRECCLIKAKQCGHSKSNSFESVWMLSDIRKAVQLGYTILAWYEIHFFPETAPFLREYSTIVYSEKIKNSGFPSNVKTIDQKLQYCDSINKKMNLPDAFKLTPFNVKNNPALRQLYKSQLNNVYGKFSQNSNQTETFFVRNQYGLENLFKTKKVLDVENILENILQVEAEHLDRKNKPISNMYVGAQIR